MKKQTFLIRCEYPDGDYIQTQEFVENIQEYFAANIMDGERGRLVVKPVYQPKEEGLVEEETKSELKFKVGDKITNGKAILTILTLSSDRYIVEDNFGECGTLCFNAQDDWKLVEEELQSKFNVGDVVYSRTWQRDVIIQEILPNGFYKVGDIQGLGWFKESEDNLRKEKNTLPTDSHSKEVFKHKISLPEGYQFVDDGGNVINTNKIVLEKKKKEYPKTYKECAEIIAELTGSDCNPKGCMGYMSVQLTALQKLFICRAVYWKIAGDEMGLKKPWEPNWTSFEGFPAIYMYRYQITLSVAKDVHHCLVFPTEEMRDAFYENFKVEIESCKELL